MKRSGFILLLFVLLTGRFLAAQTIRVEQHKVYSSKALSKENYYFQSSDSNYILYSWSWKKRHSICVTNSFDSISKKPIEGYQVNAGNHGVYCLIKDKIYYTESLTGKKKLIAKFPIYFKGIKYGQYEGLTQSAEGYTVVYDFLNDAILVGVKPMFQYNLSGDVKSKKEILTKAYLILEINTKGKVIDAIGKYDSIYNNQNQKAAAVFHFTINHQTNQVLITQKSSTKIQVYDLKRRTLLYYNLNTSNVRGSFQNYKLLNNKDTQEAMMKRLIEAPSFGDILFNPYSNLYYVLRTDSMIDSTWINTSQLTLFNPIKSPIKLKTKNQVCSAGSQQFFHQLRNYSSKPLFIQVYDGNFQFQKEYRINMKSSARFVKANANNITICDPLVIKGLFEFKIP